MPYFNLADSNINNNTTNWRSENLEALALHAGLKNVPVLMTPFIPSKTPPLTNLNKITLVLGSMACSAVDLSVLSAILDFLLPSFMEKFLILL